MHFEKLLFSFSRFTFRGLGYRESNPDEANIDVRGFFQEGMSKDERVGWVSRLLENQFVRSFLIFSVFRAIYGAGILLITYLLATSEEAPIWISVAFLLSSMVISRIIFKAIKRKWPGLA